MKGLLRFLHIGSLTPGQSREEDLIARFGRPADEHVLPDGTRRLDFPQQPEGTENWRACLGPDGVLRSLDQLLDEANFARILPGLTRSEVRELLGRPAEEAHYSRLEEDVMSWRYGEFGNRRMFFNAHFDGSGRLKHTSRTPDPSQTGDQ